MALNEGLTFSLAERYIGAFLNDGNSFSNAAAKLGETVAGETTGSKLGERDVGKPAADLSQSCPTSCRATELGTAFFRHSSDGWPQACGCSTGLRCRVQQPIKV